MNPLWTHLIIQTLMRHQKKDSADSRQLSNYKLAKAHKSSVIELKRYLKDTVLITAGIFSAAFGFKGFLLTNRFIDGGGNRYFIIDFCPDQYSASNSDYSR
jgi:hypothetical protein